MSVNFLLTGLSTNEKRLDLLIKAFNMTYGAGDGTRTRDLLITSQLLYQLSYTGKIDKWRSRRDSNPRPLA